MLRTEQLLTALCTANVAFVVIGDMAAVDLDLMGEIAGAHPLQAGREITERSPATIRTRSPPGAANRGPGGGTVSGTSGVSPGKEAHETLAIAMDRLGGKSNACGGDERIYSVNTEHLLGDEHRVSPRSHSLPTEEQVDDDTATAL